MVDGKLTGPSHWPMLSEKVLPKPIKQFREQGIKTYMATGDNAKVGKASDTLDRWFLCRGIAAPESGTDQGDAVQGRIRGDDR
ncbi:MAG: hypothetical protein R2818_05785 [Flavobacteriales bacterium]